MTCDVYLSTNRADLISSANVPLFPAGKKVATAVAGTAGAQSTATVAVPSDTVSYWMVATKSTNGSDPNNAAGGYAGPVWKFENLVNTPPTSDAGPDRYTYVSAGTITITGIVTDDGHPTGATVTCTWKTSGGTPIATTVVPNGDDTYTCSATVAVGALDSVTTYTLEGNDTTGAGSDTMNVTVKSTPCAAAKADPTYVKNVSDINDDCFVSFTDFAIMANKWKVCTALDADCD